MSLTLLYVAATLSWAAPPQTAEVLPLRKLRLYETGVGYFERRGGVRPGGDLSLPLPASHLDDALKTLVILDASGDTHVEGLQFASAVSESGARAMAGLQGNADDPVGYVDVLLSLEGSEIEVRHAGGKTRGTLVEIEGPFHPPKSKDAAEGEVTEPWHAVVMVSEDGSIHRLRTDGIASVRAVDKGTQARLKVAAEALSEQSARRAHPLDVRVSSTGQLGLGYIAESPVWRTTYRVVLPDSGLDAELQAWALVHNDTDEDWEKVGLELANGRPQSFLYPLAAPRYAWRDITGPEDDLSTVPQLANNTADRMWGDGEGGLGISGHGYGGGGSGEGTIGLGNVGLIGRGGGSGVGVGGPSIGDLAELSKAEGEESGSLFIYKISDPLDLDAHHSALVPIVQQVVEAESITWFPPGESQALTGARLVNSTTQTLPAGVVAFFGDGGFVGETALHRLKPKERQFVAFGTEQDVELETSDNQRTEEVISVRYYDGALSTQTIVRRQRTLSVTNRSGRARKVYVALDVGRNAKITGDIELDFDLDTDSALAAIEVPGGGSAAPTLSIETGNRGLVQPGDEDGIAGLIGAPLLPEAQREHLVASLAQRKIGSAARSELGAIRGRLKRQEAELDRLRADLDAVGRVRLRGGVAKKLARRLLDTERRVEESRDELKDVRHKIRVADAAAEAALLRLEK